MSARRAPAPGAGRVRLEVDWSRCRGHGHCAELLPELVRPDPWGYPIVGSTTDGVATAEGGVVPRGAEAAADRAVSWCPNLALRLRPLS